MVKRINLKALPAISIFFLLLGWATASGGTIYVDATKNGDGSSWANAYRYLQDALADAKVSGNDIWVAAGTYEPDANSNEPNGTGDQWATFQLISGVAVYGGFPSGGGTWSERNPVMYETKLSGDLAGNDTQISNPIYLNSDPNRNENSYHVVEGSQTDANTVLDGFTITAAKETNWGSGGMYNDQGSPTVANCKFTGNIGFFGGGIYNTSNSNPMVTNCTFTCNVGNYGGGGIYNGGSSPMVINCTFSGNTGAYGGGMFNLGGSKPTVTNCTFSGNLADYYGGGGIYNDTSSPTVTNCLFTGNSTSDEYNYGYGGGICNSNGNPTLTNCTFSGNTADYGGGIYCSSDSNSTISNCILWGNSADTNGAEIALTNSNHPSILTISYSDVQGGQAAAHVETNCTLNWGPNNIVSDPQFVDSNNPDPNLRDYHLRPGSPCINAGYNTALPADTADLDNDGNTTEQLPWDIDTDVRVSGGIVDMGSDEAIWASDQDVDQGEEVILNPGGGGTDPNTEALVVFENLSGPNDTTIEVTEVGTDLHPPDGLFRALGRTIRINTSLADGEFFMTVSIPFDANDLAGEDPNGVDLLYWVVPPGKWRHAVKANTQGQESNSKKDRYQEIYPPTSAPTLADLKARGMGANGVFWNTVTQQGFVWANVDHTTDFEGLIHNIADFEPDGDVDFIDFVSFAPNWLDISCGLCGGADLTGDGNVDFDDLKRFTDNWLAGK